MKKKIVKILAVTFMIMLLCSIFVACKGRGDVVFTRVDAVKPTCTTAGNTAYYVGNDGLYYKRTLTGYKIIEEGSWIIPATGHQAIVKDVAVNPTCEETGLTEGQHCALCGEVIIAQEVVPALGHAYVVTIISDSTARYTCATCGKTFDAEYIPGTVRAGATVSAVVVPSTTTEEGYILFTYLKDYAVIMGGDVQEPVIVARIGDTYKTNYTPVLPVEETTTDETTETTTAVTDIIEFPEETTTDIAYITETTTVEQIETTVTDEATTVTEGVVTTEETTDEVTTVTEEVTTTEEVVTTEETTEEVTTVEEITTVETVEVTTAEEIESSSYVIEEEVSTTIIEG